MASTQQKPSLVQRELKKGVNLLKEDASSVGALASEAARSGAYLYPLRGIIYFLRNPKLFRSVQPIILKSALMSAVVLTAMFFFTYLPQVAMLAFVSGPLAFIAAIPVVLTESWVLVTFLNKTFYVSDASLKVFDTVLAQRGHADLVQKGRSISGKGKGGALVMGKSLLKPVTSKFSTEGMVRYLLTLPLNFIPGVGTAFFLAYNGQHAGPSHHNRYFQLKGLSKAEREAFVTQRRGAYTSFGVASLALGLVPIVGTLFAFTTAAGAALWAAELENGERKGVEMGKAGEDEVVQVVRFTDEL